MQEQKGDIWSCIGDVDAVCITTNGCYTSSGAVMGRGTARQAALRWPRLPWYLGWLLRQHGNHVYILHVVRDTAIVSLPVKHDWRERADITLIQDSLRELVTLSNMLGWGTIVLPRPGCGAGGLTWKEVRPVVEQALDSRFIVVERRDDGTMRY